MDAKNQAFRWVELLREVVSYSNQTQFARQMGFSEREVSRWINGRTTPSGHNVALILNECERLGINFKKFRGIRPVYDFQVSYERNVADGPQDVPYTNLRLPKVTSRLLGYELNSPLGIPASVLTLNSKWIEPLVKTGWDVITAKTVRTKPEFPHPMPNWGYLPELQEPLEPTSVLATVRATTDIPDIDISKLSGGNSFGMPSSSPAEWQEDLRATKNLLSRGQILIVSVVGTADETKNGLAQSKSLIDDFVDCARLASEVEPHGLELNFSCPNVYGKEGSIFHDPETAAKICKRIRAEVGGKILVKIGYLPDDELDQLYKAIYKFVDGFTAINTASAKVVSAGQREEPFFPGEKRASGGVSGVAIRNIALSTVRRLRDRAIKTKPELEIIGVGGISSAEHVKLFEDAGANVVQICTAALFDPFIAVEIRKQLARERNPPNYSPTLERAGLQVSFRDQYSQEVFETVIRVSNNMDVPFDVVYSVVQKKWLSDYLAQVGSLQSTNSQTRTRLGAPSEDQIRIWVQDELDK